MRSRPSRVGSAALFAALAASCADPPAPPCAGCDDVDPEATFDAGFVQVPCSDVPTAAPKPPDELVWLVPAVCVGTSKHVPGGAMPEIDLDVVTVIGARVEDTTTPVFNVVCDAPEPPTSDAVLTLVADDGATWWFSFPTWSGDGEGVATPGVLEHVGHRVTVRVDMIPGWNGWPNASVVDEAGLVLAVAGTGDVLDEIALGDLTVTRGPAIGPAFECPTTQATQVFTGDARIELAPGESGSFCLAGNGMRALAATSHGIECASGWAEDSGPAFMWMVWRAPAPVFRAVP